MWQTIKSGTKIIVRVSQITSISKKSIKLFGIIEFKHILAFNKQSGNKYLK